MSFNVITFSPTLNHLQPILVELSPRLSLGPWPSRDSGRHKVAASPDVPRPADRNDIWIDKQSVYNVCSLYLHICIHAYYMCIYYVNDLEL